jgi:hypothetical protein
VLAAVNQYIRTQKWDLAQSWIENHPEYDWTTQREQLEDAKRATAGGET